MVKLPIFVEISKILVIILRNRVKKVAFVQVYECNK